MSQPAGPPDSQRSARLKLFLVCGMTGAGKSTFINSATGAQLAVSSEVDSETPEVIEKSIPLIRSGDEYIQLVDTPGFGDSRLESETDVLRPIASWLAARHLSRYPVTGVIFIRPMETVRVNQEERSLMLMFKDMVGEDLLDHIVLLTTRWPSERNEEYEKREKDITSRDDLLGSHGAKKVQVQQLKEDYSPEDARGVIKSCLSLSSVTFQIQREIIDEEKTLGQTEAGIKIGADLGEKLSGLEDQAKKATEYAKRAKKQLEETEKAKRELEERVARATDDAKRAGDLAKAAQQEALAAKDQSDQMRSEAEERARRAEEDRQKAQSAAEEAQKRSDEEKKAMEDRLKKFEAEIAAGSKHEEKYQNEMKELRDKIEGLNRPVKRGFWNSLANAALRFVTLGGVGVDPESD